MILSALIPLFGRYYNSIDEMPIANWFKLQETNDLRHVMKCKKALTKKQVAELELAVKKMQNEYIDTFGINEHYKNYLELTRSIRVLEIKKTYTGDRSLNTEINIKKAELTTLTNEAQKQDVSSVQIHVQKYIGFRMNLKEMSVKEFYAILEEMKKEFAPKPTSAIE